MKKFLAILTVLAIIFTMSMVSFAALQENVVGNYCTSDTGTPVQMFPGAANTPIETLGAVFSAVAEFKAVGIICPSWSDDVGNLTVTLYKWDKDYETTLKGTPVAGPEVFEDYEDNSFIGFDFEASPMAAGVYYIQLSDAEDDAGSGVGCWSGTTVYPGQYVFVDGEYLPKMNLRMQLDYVTELAEGALPYGEMPTLEKPKSDLGGEGTLPHYIYFDLTKEDKSVFIDGSVTFAENEDGTLHVTVPAGTVDSMYDLQFASHFDYDALDDGISCADYPYIAMRIRITDPSIKNGPGEAFMYTSSIGGATPGYSTAIPYDYGTGDWQTVVIDPTANKVFKENALDNEDVWTGFRFDVLNATPSEDGDFDIAWIAFFQNEDAAMAFDGDFSKADESKPTPKPTPEPTDTPAPTEPPVETEAPEVTEAPTTEEPAATKAPENKGCGGIVGGAVAVAVAALGAVLVIRKKH